MLDKVKQILTDYPKAREDDNFLFITYLKNYTDIDVYKPLNTVFINHSDYNLPSYASIIRARRKAQEQNAELNPPPKVKDMREREEEQYREFYGQKGLLY